MRAFKINSTQKAEILEYLKDERIAQRWIAKKYGVGQSAIAYYKKKHLKKPENGLI